ncbi:hypothetical protein B8W96_02715 [Lentilactobacillus parakefiri]|uniref:hypothetical protein n=1 Tax=Lentilactobacillus parakefiri TaxID=152332 RepID=UPI000BA51108|nr:hypothetical protein [Lentilactobacillus parakefiri]PAL01181.1 hypothetical protein B8W96_02715 [Lentilactobacillus parakefiri]
MTVKSTQVNQHHQVLRASLALLGLTLFAVGIWATILLVLTTKISVALILVLGGGWAVLFCIGAGLVILWRLIQRPQQVSLAVHRLRWLLGIITVIIATMSLTFAYIWAKSGDAPGLIFIGLFLSAMPFACWVVVSVWQTTLKSPK